MLSVRPSRVRTNPLSDVWLVGEIQNPEKSSRRKSSRRKELEEKRARTNKQKEMGRFPFPSVQSHALGTNQNKNRRCLRCVARSPLCNPTHPVHTKLKNGGCLGCVGRKTQTPSVRRTKPSSHSPLSLVHLPEVNARERDQP
jgi:hypothetical protein